MDTTSFIILATLVAIYAGIEVWAAFAYAKQYNDVNMFMLAEPLEPAEEYQYHPGLKK